MAPTAPADPSPAFRVRLLVPRSALGGCRESSPPLSGLAQPVVLRGASVFFPSCRQLRQDGEGQGWAIGAHGLWVHEHQASEGPLWGWGMGVVICFVSSDPHCPPAPDAWATAQTQALVPERCRDKQ